MNNRYLFPLICFLATLLIGCDRTEPPPAPPSVSASSEIPSLECLLTTQEIDLLSDIYPNEADRIQRGELFTYQEESLIQLRAATIYLENKYPGEVFELTCFEPATKLNSIGTLTVEDGGNYAVYIEFAANGYSCSDIYYIKFLQQKYDEYLAQVLAAGGYTAKTYTYFPAASTDLGPDITLEELVLTTPKLARASHIYVVAEDQEVAIAGIQELIAQAGIYGSYSVYFITTAVKPRPLGLGI